MLHRSIYDRWLGIASLRIQTAGQSSTQATLGYEGNLAGLLEWEELLHDLQEIVKKYHQTDHLDSARDKSLKAGNEEILEQILRELKAIRKGLEK